MSAITTKKKYTREAKLALQAGELTRKMPEGTRVRYWPSGRSDKSQEGTIAGAFHVFGYTVGVTVNDAYQGHWRYVVSSHIESI